MSELRADTITASDGTSPVTLTGQIAAKAWVNFNGTGTIAIRDSHNASSLTDNGTGDHSVNYTSNMDNVNYCVTGGTGYAYANSGARDSNCQPYDLTTSLFDLSVGVLNSGGASARDHGIVTASVHGDLA